MSLGRPDHSASYGIDRATARLLAGNSESALVLKSHYVPFWTAGEAVTAGSVRMTALGVTIKRNADGTTRSSYDSAESALWTVTGGTGGGGSATTSASDLTSGTLAPALIADGTLPFTKMTGTLTDSQVPASLTTTVAGKLAKTANLSDVANVATARTNLGLSAVAATGSYGDLAGKPTIPTAPESILPFSRPGALTVGAGAVRFPIPFACTILGAVASISSTASSDVIIDVNRNGTSLFNAGGRPTIPVGSNTSQVATASVAAVAGDYLTVDVDQVGTGSTTVPSFIARTDGNAVFGQSQTISRPAAAAVGDIHLGSVWVNTGGTIGDTNPAATVITTPSNWTRIGTGPFRNAYNANDRFLELHMFWWRDDGTQSSWSFTATTPASGSYITPSVVTYRGCAATGSPIDSFASASPAASNTTWTAPTVTTTAVSDLLVNMWWSPNTVTSPVYPSGETVRTGTLVQEYVSDKAIASAGATGTQTLTGSTSTSNRVVAMSVALLGNSSGTPVPGSDLTVAVRYRAS